MLHVQSDKAMLLRNYQAKRTTNKKIASQNSPVASMLLRQSRAPHSHYFPTLLAVLRTLWHVVGHLNGVLPRRMGEKKPKSVTRAPVWIIGGGHSLNKPAKPHLVLCRVNARGSPGTGKLGGRLRFWDCLEQTEASLPAAGI